MTDKGEFLLRTVALAPVIGGHRQLVDFPWAMHRRVGICPCATAKNQCREAKMMICEEGNVP